MTAADGDQATDNTQLLAHLDEVVADLEITAPPPAPAETVARRRRRRAKRIDARQGTIAFVERQGVLYLDDAAPTRQLGGTRRRRARAAGLGGKVVKKVPFERLAPSDVHTALQTLDKKLTPNQGFRQWEGGSKGSLVAAKALPRSGRVLLLVHGTFSNTDNFFTELVSHRPGRDLLDDLKGSYRQVLTFDHPTLGVSPLLNARELALHMTDTPAEVDVICHSRGGLVTRWWLEALDRAPLDRRRVVFVGSPLAGTGLASPARLRASLNMLANVGNVLGKVSGAASSAVPFLAVATGLFRVITSITRFTAKTPLIDAAVAMVPGLDAQSRVGNNAEMLSLRRPPPEVTDRYFIIKSNFEPEEVGWRFWKIFRKPMDRVKDLGADFVFEGENDLVVDTESMSDFEDKFIFPKSQIRDFGTSTTVRHTNYFQQERTVEFIRTKLEI